MDRRVPGDEDGLAPDRDVAPAAEARGLVVLGTVALICFVALAVWARLAAPAPWEPDVVAALALGEGPWPDLVRGVNTLGDLPVWAALLAVLAVVLGALRGIVAAILVGFSFAADLAAFAVKLLVERARPETLASEHLFGFDSFAFPSGHVVRAVALAAVLAWLLVPRQRLVAAVLAAAGAGLAMGYARVALGVHWPTDALGGLLLGTGWFAVAAIAAGLVKR